MTVPPAYLKEIPGGFRLAIRLQPKGHRNEVVGASHGFLKIKVQAPPVEGAANAALIQFLRRLLKIPAANIQIKSGEKSRNKQVEIQGLNFSEGVTRVLTPHKS